MDDVILPVVGVAQVTLISTAYIILSESLGSNIDGEIVISTIVLLVVGFGDSV